MSPPLQSVAPASWSVAKDGQYVRLLRGPLSIEVNGPILGVYDSHGDAWSRQPLPPRGYSEWLRRHPSLAVLEDQSLIVDGVPVSQLTLEVTDGVPGMNSGVRLGWSDDMADARGWPTYAEGTVVIQSVIEVDGRTVVVTSSGADSESEQVELRAATALVLSTMELPG